MSKIGKLPIPVKEGITVTITGSDVKVTGPKGDASFVVPQGIVVEQQDGMLVVRQKDPQSVTVRPLFGLTRAILANIVKGVEVEFERKLELAGVGYRAQVQGADLVLSLGFSHPVKIKPPEGVSFAVAESIITVKGRDKTLVGNTASQVRAVRPPEPYKGKGIKYVGERVRRKAGKAAKAVGATK